MSEQPNTPAPEAPKPEAPKPAEPGAPAPQGDTKPPWGSNEEFNPQKAWDLIQGLRSDKERLSKREALTDEHKSKLAEYDRLAEASKTELQKAQEAAQSNAQRAQALLDRAVQAEIKALANQFADPEDAHVFLDVKKYAGKDGDIDTAAIQADLADLLTRKPHLGKSPESRTPAPNPAQGSSGGGASGPSQLSEADVQRMYAAKDYAGIEKARQEGRLSNLLGG